MAASPTLVCQALTQRFRNGFQLGPLSTEIGVGVTCLVGPNGAGKSTFFRLAAGVDDPVSGSIGLIGGEGNARLGYLPQEVTFPGAATCRQFLEHVAWLQRVPGRDRPAAVSDALGLVGLADRADTRIKELSGGMLRRLGVAHTLVHSPAMLLLDEPTVALDPRQRVALREVIESLAQGRIVIVATHLVEDIRGLADRVIVINDGSTIFDGTVAQLEERADPQAPGDSDLERAISSLMGDPR